MRVRASLSVFTAAMMLGVVGTQHGIVGSDRTGALRQDGCVYCPQEFCLPGHHIGAENGLTNTGVHRDCVADPPYGPCSGHPPCNWGSLDLGDVLRAYVHRDMDELRRLVREYPDRVYVHASRAAIQVTACGGIVAHLPVETTDIASLLE